MKKKVIIVEPKGSQANVFDKYMNLPLMGPVYLGTILKDAGFDVIIYNENFMRGERFSINHMDADFLLLSLLTPTVERGFEIARQFRQVNPKAKIIIGGVHPTLMSSESLEFADYVVEGEGESIIVDLLNNGSDTKLVKTTRIQDLDTIPIPDFTLLYNHKIMDMYPMITSRGCPFDCNFCSVTKTFGKKHRRASIDRIIEELKQVKLKEVFFYDDNFTANPKRTKALLQRMIDEKIKKTWTTQTRIDIAQDRELLGLMKKSGCRTIYIGFESIDNDVLKGYKKSQTADEIEKAINIIHEFDIEIHGMFMFGSDFDTKEIFKNTVRFCKKNHIETLQFMVLTPFPGTKVYEDMDRAGRLLHKNWNYYDALHVVYKPKNFTPKELQDYMIRSFEEFYSFTHTIGDALVVASTIPSSVRLTLTRLFARHIISKWKRINRDYVSFLGRS